MMNTKKIVIAYCSANKEVAAEIAHQLQYADFTFELVTCNDFKDTTRLEEQKVILLVSDNFLKSLECMGGGMVQFQQLINNGHLLPVVIDGTYPQPDGNGVMTVPTKFQRVSSVIKYMNFWQDEYLEMRKQKRDVPAGEIDAFNQRLKTVRTISSDVGEFLRFLRDNYYCDYETFSADNFQIFFQKFSNQPAYIKYANEVAQNPIPTLVPVTAAAVVAATPTVTEIITEQKVAVEEPVLEMATATVAEAKNVVGTVTTTARNIQEKTIVNETIEINQEPLESGATLNETERLAQELALKLPKKEVPTPPTEEPTALVNVEEAIENLTETPTEVEELVASKAMNESDLLRNSHELVQRGALEEGLSLLESNLAIRPDMVAARYQYSVFLAQHKEDYESASNQLDQILSIQPNNLPANFFLGELAEAQGDFLAAKKYYEKVAQINPSFPNLHHKLGLLLSRRFKYEAPKAAEHLLEAHTQDPKNMEALYNWGLVQYESLENPTGALEAFNKVAIANPAHPFVNYDLALAHYKLNNRLQAYQYYQKACAINPELKTAENDLAFAVPEQKKQVTEAVTLKTVKNEVEKETAAVMDDSAEAVGTKKTTVITTEKINGIVSLSQDSQPVSEEEKEPDYTLEYSTDTPEPIVRKEEITIIETVNTPDVVNKKEVETVQVVDTPEVIKKGEITAITEIVNTPDTIDKKEVETVQAVDTPDVVVEKEKITVVESVETPDVVVEKEEITVIKEKVVNKTEVQLEDLIIEDTKKTVSKVIVDEEKLEAEFDAQIDALGAAGFGIAAGASIEEKVVTVETTTSSKILPKTEDSPPKKQETVIKKTVVTKLKQPKDPEKIVLITGATSGIGRATAAVFAEHGYDLILTGRRFSRLFKLKEIFQADFNNQIQVLPFDLRSPAAVETAVAELPVNWRNVDILINNAGLALGFDPIHEGNLEDWETMIDTNIKGLLYMTRAIAPFMVERRKGHIINISSIAGKEVYPNGNVYCASKHAVEALTKAMRIDLHKYNIRVSQVAPGHVEETEFAQVRFHGDKDRAKIYDDFVPVNSRDIAETIYFIATRPAHVNIQDVLIMGTQQASATMTNRSGR